MLARYNGLGSTTVRQSRGFRRIIDGSKAGLALIPKAIATHDSELLRRILIELRSFDCQLTLLFG